MPIIQEVLSEISPGYIAAIFILLFGLVITFGVCIRLYHMKATIEKEVRELMYGEEPDEDDDEIEENEVNENPEHNSPDVDN